MDNEDILFENKLINHFYRWDCPNPFDLGDYILKLCSSESGLFIQAHSNHCLLCRKEIEDLKDLLEKSIYPLEKESINKKHSRLTPFPLNTLRPDKNTDSELKRAVRGDHEFLKELEIKIKHKDKEEVINLFFKIEPFDGEYLININLAAKEYIEKVLINAFVEVWQKDAVTATTVDEYCSITCRIEKISSLLIRLTNKTGTVFYLPVMVQD